MHITNYWFLLIYILSIGVIGTLFPFKQKENSYSGDAVYRLRPIAAFACFFPYWIWAGSRTTSWGDTHAYISAFNDAPRTISELPVFVAHMGKDYGFYSLMVIIKSLIGNNAQIFLFIVATVQVALLIPTLRKFSSNYWFSIFVFVATGEYMAWMHNGIRQFVAVCIVFSTTKWMVEKKYVRVIIIILIASLIHQTALLMIPFVFIVVGKAWNKRTILSMVVVIFIITSVSRFTSFLENMLVDTQYSSAVNEMVNTLEVDGGANVYRVLVFSIPCLLSLLGLRYIKNSRDPVIHLAVNFSILTTGLFIVAMFSSGIFMGRLPIYTSLYSNCILLPWEIENFFEEKSSKIIMFTSVLAYSVFFYYQMHMAWGLL